VSRRGRGLSERLDAVSSAVGRAASWLTLLMVLLTLLIVVLRYAFDSGQIWLQELLTWMHALVFMLGAAYTLQLDGHVRVDVFYRDMSERQRAWVNALGVLLFVFPLCGYFVYESLPYIGRSFGNHEISRDAGGLPYPAIPVLKSVLLVMPLAVALQGLALLLNAVGVLRRR